MRNTKTENKTLNVYLPVIAPGVLMSGIGGKSSGFSSFTVAIPAAVARSLPPPEYLQKREFLIRNKKLFTLIYIKLFLTST